MVTYEIDKTRGIVAAMYQRGERDVDKSLDAMLHKLVDCNSLVNIDIDIDKIMEKYMKQGRFALMGIARCHKDDTWDEEKGKEIARNRLNRKFIVLKNDILREILTRLDRVYCHTANKVAEKIWGKNMMEEDKTSPVVVHYDPKTMEIVD